MIKIYRNSEFSKYRVAFNESQGIDLSSIEDYIIEPLSRKAIRTGIHISLPFGTFGFIKERSSVALNKGLIAIAGVIDNNYRGELLVVLYNTNKNEYVKIEKGEFVAQLLIVKVLEPREIVEVGNIEELGQTKRGIGGFGSSDR
ncbi:MAG: dUTP diphosphatase [candidate division WOR-3 bacterium]|nr:dUTP diphosphatase [candidate division WOR-3 bacterium]MCX7947833.1 dUTP diphosphatase [candidate division WOR-3 bacterium]MDW8151280.1 dUTP diphosphatase [candidate division WOR-3 bacterium]